MLTRNETIPSDGEIRAAALEAALRVGCGLDNDGNTSADGSVVIKNAKLFLNFLKGEANV